MKKQTKPLQNTAPRTWWVNWLAPQSVLDEHDDALLDEWLGHEKSVCHGLIKKTAAIAALTAPLFYFLDTLRPTFDSNFSLLHRGSTAFCFGLLVCALLFKVLDRFKYAYVGYKIYFLLSGTILCGFQTALMFRNPDIPRAYAPVIMVIMIATSAIGPKNSIIVSIIHSLMLVFFGLIAITTNQGWQTIVGDLSMQTLGVILVFVISTKYTLQSRLFVASWKEKKIMNEEIDSKQVWGQHAFNQLTKLVFPHVVERIHDGADIEETMPLGVQNAYTIAFDIIGSSKVTHEKFYEAVEKTFIGCWDVMMENYKNSPLESNAYRVKEMGDGFLCSVGYPFTTPNGQSGASVAIEIAHRFIAVFRQCMDELDYVEPIHCGIGIAHGTIEGYFPKGDVKQYDLRGRSIILATRYEALRKTLPERLTGSSDIIILSDYVFCNLPSEVRREFETLNLPSLNLKIRDDVEARQAHYKCLNRVDKLTLAPAPIRKRAA